MQSARVFLTSDLSVLFRRLEQKTKMAYNSTEDVFALSSSYSSQNFVWVRVWFVPILKGKTRYVPQGLAVSAQCNRSMDTNLATNPSGAIVIVCFPP